MRTKAQEVAKRRAWAERAPARRSRSEAIRVSLDSPGHGELVSAWEQLRARTLRDTNVCVQARRRTRA